MLAAVVAKLAGTGAASQKTETASWHACRSVEKVMKT
jgi:hypothetical protein